MGDLTRTNRPLQLEQPKLYHENPSQEIEEIQEGETTTQIEVPPPQPEVEADLVQITEAQTSQIEAHNPQTEAYTSQTGALTRKRKRATTTPKAPIERKRISRWTRQPKEIEEMTKQIQEMIE